jgi:hypothetical protein
MKCQRLRTCFASNALLASAREDPNSTAPKKALYAMNPKSDVLDSVVITACANRGCSNRNLTVNASRLVMMHQVAIRLPLPDLSVQLLTPNLVRQTGRIRPKSIAERFSGD